METIIDLATVSYVNKMVGEPTPQTIIPSPVLFASNTQCNQLYIFGLGFLTEDMVHYPFTVQNLIGDDTFIGTTKDAVYLYPFSLLRAASILRFNVHILIRDTGKLERTVELSRPKAEKLAEGLDNKYTVVAIPSLIEDHLAEDVMRYKIMGGNLYENIGVMWKHVTPYEVRLDNEHFFDRSPNDKRKEVASRKREYNFDDNDSGSLPES